MQRAWHGGNGSTVAPTGDNSNERQTEHEIDQHDVPYAIERRASGWPVLTRNLALEQGIRPVVQVGEHSAHDQTDNLDEVQLERASANAAKRTEQ